MKRSVIYIILVCMMISTHAFGYYTNNMCKHQAQISIPIDSIVIIYRNMEMVSEDLKITVSPSCGNIQFVKRYIELHQPTIPQKLCEWQRKEIFDTLVGIYVTGSVKIGKGKMPTHNATYATPPEMYVTIFSGGHIKKEHLIIYHINDDDDFKYSDEFHHLHDLLAILLLVFRDNLPIVC